MSRHEPMPTLASGTADAVLDALPHPVIMVAADGRIANANAAAESFFDASLPLLRRHMLRDLVPFGSPLLALIEQVRGRGAAVNEYKVDLGTPRNPGERLVDHRRRGSGDAAEHRVGGLGAERDRGLTAHPQRLARRRGGVAGRHDARIVHAGQCFVGE